MESFSGDLLYKKLYKKDHFLNSSKIVQKYKVAKMQSLKDAKLQKYNITKMQSHKDAKSQRCKVTKMRSAKVALCKDAFGSLALWYFATLVHWYIGML